MKPQTVAGTTVGQGNNQAPSDTCFDFGTTPSNGEDIVYKWTAPSAGTYVFDTLTNSIDTVLYLWPGCGGPELVCNDDFADPPEGNTGSQVGLEMAAGQSVLIVVDSYSTSGSFSLHIAGPAASGNCCAQRSTGGCQDTTVETCICEVDSYCCNTSWDHVCVEEAIAICNVTC